MLARILAADSPFADPCTGYPLVPSRDVRRFFATIAGWAAAG